MKFKVAIPFFTLAPINFVPLGINVLTLSDASGPASRFFIASVSGESVFGTVFTTGLRTIEPSESIATK